MLTDNETKKALECCCKGSACNECPLLGKKDCMNKLYHFSFDCVDHLQAENERLNKEVDRLSQVVLYNDGVTEMLVEEAKAEACKEAMESAYRMLTTVKNWEEFKVQWLENGECFWLKGKLDRLSKELIGE